MNKRLIAAGLAASLLFSFSACNKNANDRETTFTAETKNTVNPDISEPNQSIGSGAMIPETTTEKTDETTVSSIEQDQTTASEETSASETTAATTAQTAGKTTVTDAYTKTNKTDNWGKVTSRVPKITIQGVSTSKINSEILKKFKGKAKSDKYKCTYSYYIGKTYVSIAISVMQDGEGDVTYNYVYNISRITGKKMSRKQMLKTLGISSKKFNSRVKKAINKFWKRLILDKGKLYKKAVSKKNLNKAVPYTNSKGKLSYCLKGVEIPAGSGDVDLMETC